MPTYDTLVTVAAENHGLVRTEDAVDAGVPAATLTRLTHAGRLERVAHGLYRVPALPEDRLTRFMEAVLWARGEGAVSHASALEMMELCDLLPRRIHITVPETYNPRKAGGEEFRVHRHTLPKTDLTYFEGVPVVTAYRAIRQAIDDAEDPAQLLLAIRTASSQGLLLRSEAARLRARLRR